MTPFKRFGIEWRWDVVILLTMSWLFGMFCTYEIVHAIHLHTQDTHEILTDVVNEMKLTSKEQSQTLVEQQDVVKRVEAIEAEQRANKVEEQEKLQQLKGILERLQKFR